jgi:hypothetical protein
MSQSQLQPPRLLEQMRAVLRARHYSLRTEGTYLGWVKRFILFHGKRHPRDMGLTFRTPSDSDPRIFSAARFARTANPNRDMVSSHERRNVTRLCLRSVLWGSCYRLSKPTQCNICRL